MPELFQLKQEKRSKKFYITFLSKLFAGHKFPSVLTHRHTHTHTDTHTHTHTHTHTETQSHTNTLTTVAAATY